VPFFTASGPVSGQENWTTHVSGYIRISQPGAYDFSVLNDDSFFLTLAGTGTGGATHSIGRDFLAPSERNGFTDESLLSPGLYGLEPGMWNRLEPGVVDLRWQTPGSDVWTLVPTTELIVMSPVMAHSRPRVELNGLDAVERRWWARESGATVHRKNILDDYVQ